MTDESGLETHAQHGNSSATQPGGNGTRAQQTRRDANLRRTLLFIGIAAASAGIAYAIVRATLARPPVDPTTERIQSLIDEANRLLKQLDDKKSAH
jgi:hypothetical protein